MKKFTFRLQSVLDVRKREEDAAKLELNAAIIALEKEKEKRRQLEQSKSEVENELLERQQGVFGIGDMVPYHTFLETIAEKIFQQDDIILKAQNFHEEKRKVVVEAMKKKKALEKLKEKKYDEWKELCQKVDKALVDELATITHDGNHENKLKGYKS